MDKFKDEYNKILVQFATTGKCLLHACNCHPIEEIVWLIGTCLLRCPSCHAGNIFGSNYELIDRREYTIEQKPLVWPCLFCKRLMGGGHQWYYDPDQEEPTDVCPECYQSVPSPSVQQDGSPIRYERLPTKYLLDTEREHLLRVQPLTDIYIPEGLRETLDATAQGVFVSSLNESYADSKINLSINAAALMEISEVEDVAFVHANTSLAIDISVLENPVYSIIYDDHGRMAFNRVHDTYERYLEDKAAWEQRIALLSPEYIQSRTSELDEQYHHGSIEEDDLAEVIDNYPAYIRLIRKLPFYYG